MPHNVPEFQFSEDALKLRQFLYEYWCAHGHGPNLRAAHEATGFARERLIAAYRELDLGLICTIEQQTQNVNLLKLQPFSSYPSQVEVWIDDKFHCWAGCAMESIALSKMPPFAGKTVRLESYCACCLKPVTVVANDAEHAAAYERQVSRRGVLFRLEQAQRFVADTGKNRMWRYDWPPVVFRPERV